MSAPTIVALDAREVLECRGLPTVAVFGPVAVGVGS
jgi:hypothetical protein